VVIEAVGKPATYRLALDLVAACGRIVYIGWVKGDIALEARQIVAKEVDIPRIAQRDRRVRRGHRAVRVGPYRSTGARHESCAARRRARHVHTLGRTA
jgi:threonine dehydrogenase-like Zn-dependent dehydrogenase